MTLGTILLIILILLLVECELSHVAPTVARGAIIRAVVSVLCCSSC